MVRIPPNMYWNDIGDHSIYASITPSAISAFARSIRLRHILEESHTMSCCKPYSYITYRNYIAQLSTSRRRQREAFRFRRSAIFLIDEYLIFLRLKAGIEPLDLRKIAFISIEIVSETKT